MARRPTGLHRLYRPSCCLARAWSWCTKAWWWASTRYAYFYYLIWLIICSHCGDRSRRGSDNWATSTSPTSASPSTARYSHFALLSLRRLVCRTAAYRMDVAGSWSHHGPPVGAHSQPESRDKGANRGAPSCSSHAHSFFLTLCETCRAGCCICSARTCAPCTSPSRRPRASRRFCSHAPPHTRTTHTHTARTRTYIPLTKMQHSISNTIDKEVDQAKHIPTEGHVIVCLQERRDAGAGLGFLRSPQRELRLPTTRPSAWSSLNDRLTLSFSCTGVDQEFMRQGALHSDWRITSVNKVTSHCPIT